ncbi:MAG: hypothetical protein KGJ13_09910 [Patescibacteria group bacterium]|nr:hypothetical protein [Patescibacteria group bacterium]
MSTTNTAPGRVMWQTGMPDVATGKRETFWCATKGEANGKIYHRDLVYANKHVMGLSDSCWEAPKNAVQIGDSDEYEWTGWFEESCDQCDTQWTFTGEVIAWMRLPRWDKPLDSYPALVETAAKALYDDYEGHHYSVLHGNIYWHGWQSETDQTKEKYRSTARAVLASLGLTEPEGKQ